MVLLLSLLRDVLYSLLSKHANVFVHDSMDELEVLYTCSSLVVLLNAHSLADGQMGNATDDAKRKFDSGAAVKRTRCCQKRLPYTRPIYMATACVLPDSSCSRILSGHCWVIKFSTRIII